MSVVIKAEHLCKEYTLGYVGATTLYSELSSKWARLRGKEDPNLVLTENAGKKHLALQDVSFEINEGEVIGIVGKNGAGKSTLLKILSRVTSPTSGTFKVKGRIASLLEVGTGFHPELSGRENIFLNGAILGMRKAEIKSKFDEIVDFSGIEKFIDTPVKRYSSGMYVRLAFAVAAHLEPEILIVDEVLAVGDAEFQNKCLGKMNDVSSNQGRTVLFVSHNMAAVKNLCKRGLFLEKGRLKMNTHIEDIIGQYLNTITTTGAYQSQGGENMKDCWIDSYMPCNEEGNLQSNFGFHDQISFRIDVASKMEFNSISIGIAVKDQWGKKIFTSVNSVKKLSKGKRSFYVSFPSGFLVNGKYSTDVAVFIPHGVTFDQVFDGSGFSIMDTDSEMSTYSASNFGVIHVACSWK